MSLKRFKNPGEVCEALGKAVAVTYLAALILFFALESRESSRAKPQDSKSETGREWSPASASSGRAGIPAPQITHAIFAGTASEISAGPAEKPGADRREAAPEKRKETRQPALSLPGFDCHFSREFFYFPGR